MFVVMLEKCVGLRCHHTRLFVDHTIHFALHHMKYPVICHYTLYLGQLRNPDGLEFLVMVVTSSFSPKKHNWLQYALAVNYGAEGVLSLAFSKANSIFVVHCLC